jgi:signal transduction histidine kinase
MGVVGAHAPLTQAPGAYWRRAVIVVATSLFVATALTMALRPYIVSAIFVFYYGAAAISALTAGLAAGIVTALVGAVLGNRLAPVPETMPVNITGTLAYLGVSTVLSLIAESVRRTRAAVEAHAEQLQRQAGELEAQRLEAQVLAGELEQSNGELEVAKKDAEASRDAALAGEDRLRFVDEVSRVLGSSLDYETTIRTVARLAVPKFADWCSVDLLIEGKIRTLAVVHVDPEKVKFARELQLKYPPRPESPTGPPYVIRTGQPIFLPRVTDEMLVETALNEEHLAILRSLTIHSVMVVPMNARGTTVGALTLVSTRPDLIYDRLTLAVAEQIATRAAVAIDNARLYRAALTANESKANFLATMSHELRTPLTAIIGYEELLSEEVSGPVTDTQRHQLARIKVSARHLLSLIDDILLYARVEAGRESLRIEPVTAKSIVDDALAFVAPTAADKNLVLRAEPIDPHLTLRTDAGKLRQMLLNLLANAMKFTSKGEVVIRVRERDDMVAFEVRDTGIGIEPDDLEHIFNPFWQVEQRTTRVAGGSGLGLSVTQHLARLLGGDVTVQSERGVGSTFTIELPKATAMLSPGETPASRPSRADGGDAQRSRKTREETR